MSQTKKTVSSITIKHTIDRVIAKVDIETLKLLDTADSYPINTGPASNHTKRELRELINLHLVNVTKENGLEIV